LSYAWKVSCQTSTCQRLCVIGFDLANPLNGAYLRQEVEGEFSHWTHETGTSTIEQDASGRWAFKDGGTPLAETLVAQSQSDMPAEDIFATADGDLIVSFFCCDGAGSGDTSADDETAAAAEEDATMALIGAIGGILACLVITGFGAMAYYSRLAAASKWKAANALPVADTKPLKRPPDLAKEPVQKQSWRQSPGPFVQLPDKEKPIDRQPSSGERPGLPAEPRSGPHAAQPAFERTVVEDPISAAGSWSPPEQHAAPRRPHEPEHTVSHNSTAEEIAVIHVGDLRAAAPHRARSATANPPTASRRDIPLREQRATMAKTMGPGSNARATDAWKQWAKVGVPPEIRQPTQNPQQPPISTPLADRILRFASNDAATDVAQIAAATWPPRELKAQDTGRAKLIAEIGEGSHGLRRFGRDSHSVRPQTCVLPGTLFPFEVGDAVALGGFDAIEETWNGALGVLEAVDLQAGNCEVRLDDGRMKVVALERVVRKMA